jgi:hypothetical protein
LLTSRTRARGLASAVAISLVALGVSAASAAPAAVRTAATSRIGSGRTATTPAGDKLTCGTSTVADRGECASVLRIGAGKTSGVTGYTPSQLRSAYNLASASVSGGRSATVAIVTAFSDPKAAGDLAAYRAHFTLPACGTGNGCLRIVNEHGSASPLPAPNASWAQSDATELDAVSALCPNCHLLLVEAASNSFTDLGTAENTAVTMLARYVLTTWNAQESLSQDAFDHYFNHPGVAIVVPATATGYERSFPGDLPYVTSVGGTTLLPTKFNTRHWAEIAWTGTGSGCSALEIKPSWQRADAHAAGCPHRTQNDVAADADPTTGAAVYNSYQTASPWADSGGTVLAAAIVTATYALAGTPARHTYPASYPYQHRSGLNDVIYGSNGPCTLNPDYICNAQQGFDGPTGLGTPDGTAAFSATGADPVTVMDPGTQDALAGATTDVKITGMDSRSGAAVTYSAKGLPAGLAVTAVPNSLNAEITGTLPANVRSYSVTVTATDTSTNKSGSARFSLVATGSLMPSAPVTHQIGTDFSPPDNAAMQCLDAGAETAGTKVTDQLCSESLQQADWSYVANPSPGAGGILRISNLCLTVSGKTVDLAACAPGTTAQAWFAQAGGGLENGSTRTCLDAGTFTGPLSLHACDTSKAGQQWSLASPLQSAVPGTCIATADHFIQPPTDVDVEPCGQSSLDYAFSYGPPGNLRLGASCVTWGFLGYVSTEANSYLSCQEGAADLWFPLPNGEILNSGNGLCLDDPGNSALPNNQLQLQACDGSLGEIWSIG